MDPTRSCLDYSICIPENNLMPFKANPVKGHASSLLDTIGDEKINKNCMRGKQEQKKREEKIVGNQHIMNSNAKSKWKPICIYI